MSEPNEESPDAEIKIFPRNLTARADYLVRGNPANSRPESGVDNCFPGLELDQRNLDQRFFNGLHFEFQREDGAILAGMQLDCDQRESTLSEADSPPERPLYLWFLFGQTEVKAMEPTVFSFRGLSGMDVWRCVHDLLPKRVTIVIGPAPGVSFYLKLGPTTELLKRVRKAHVATAASERYHVERKDGAIEFAVLSQDRAPYLTDEGVIDISSYPPGELTKTLCAPWMYDFRDCYCFYWAANKPDLVSSTDGNAPYLNFLRRRDGADPNAPDTAVWDGRRAKELQPKDMVEGWWNRLPVVIDDREADPPEAPHATRYAKSTRPLLDPDQAMVKLGHLAELEHALTVEYLYAMYSIAVPKQESNLYSRIRFAVEELRAIAIDEMRHFLWVNEALALLGGRSPSTKRATKIGPEGAVRDFKLRRLTGETLESFVQIEKGSRTTDGMYAQVLESVTGWPKQGTPEELGRRERLADLLKLIVDEGDEHYHRFLAVKTALDGLSESQYLREFQAAPEPPSPDLLLCDEYYRTILTAIHVSFSQGDRAGREITREAIALMNGLDAAARRLCAAGIAPGFTLPTPWPPEGGPAQMLEGPAAEIQTLLDRITQEDPDARDLDRQRQDIVAWRERMLKLLPTLFSS